MSVVKSPKPVNPGTRRAGDWLDRWLRGDYGRDEYAHPIRIDDMTAKAKGRQEPCNRILSLFAGVCLFQMVAAVSFADELDIVRTGPCSYRCVDPSGVQEDTCHTGWHVAVEVCHNRAAAEPGKLFIVRTSVDYRVTVTSDSVEEPPPPPENTGAATLSWEPPTQNTDGSPLTDLAGYRIFYGREPGTYSYTVEIDNPTVTTYVIEDLAPGDWYFTSLAYNNAGAVSEYSNEASKTVE